MSTAAAAIVVVAFLVAGSAGATAAAGDSLSPYNNHTVGDTFGWFFNAKTNTPAANYSAWAANITFDLGEFLIFNTNTNQTVVQTYNETTYAACSADDDYGNLTYVFTNGTEQAFGLPVSVAVPLTIEGRQFYFSDFDDGNQCAHGMRFAIVVGHGRGVPPSLSQPPPPPVSVPPPALEQTGAPPGPSSQSETFHNGGSRRVGAISGSLLFSSLAIFLQ